MTISKIMDFKETDLFQENDQNEQISVIPMDFPKRAFYHLVYLYEKLSIFIKSPDFSVITDFSDSKGFSKESLPPVVVFVWNITKMTEMNRFQWNQRNNRF